MRSSYLSRSRLGVAGYVPSYRALQTISSLDVHQLLAVYQLVFFFSEPAAMVCKSHPGTGGWERKLLTVSADDNGRAEARAKRKGPVAYATWCIGTRCLDVSFTIAHISTANRPSHANPKLVFEFMSRFWMYW